MDLLNVLLNLIPTTIENDISVSLLQAFLVQQKGLAFGCFSPSNWMANLRKQ